MGDGHLVHRKHFIGRIEYGSWAPEPGDLVLADDTGLPVVSGAAISKDAAMTRTGVPTDALAHRLADHIAEGGPPRLVAIGDGATLDVAKQAATFAGAAAPPLVLVPAGAEPWRAFSAFTSLYGDDGVRRSRPSPVAVGTAVVVDAALAVAHQVRAIRRADTLVQSVDVLLCGRATPWDRALAALAIRLLRNDDPATDLTAAGLVTEAFGSCGLGLAHAIASPVGALSGRTHDVANVILGSRAVRVWGDRVDWSPVAGAAGVPASASAVGALLNGYRVAAGVPDSLVAAGYDAAILDEAAARAMNSSGMPWLPGRVEPEQLRTLVLDPVTVAS